jgi:hypothetical protein
LPRYRVSFFKNLLSSDGHQFKCLQSEVDIAHSDSATQAVEVATQQFARLHRLKNWKLMADSVEVEPVELATLILKWKACETHRPCKGSHC